jgi:hypothetical protein
VGPPVQYPGLNRLKPVKSFSKEIQMILNNFTSMQTLINMTFSELKKIEIKYGCQSFEESNNFLHRKFSRLKTDLELNIWESKV